MEQISLISRQFQEQIVVCETKANIFLHEKSFSLYATGCLTTMLLLVAMLKTTFLCIHTVAMTLHGQ